MFRKQKKLSAITINSPLNELKYLYMEGKFMTSKFSEVKKKLGFGCMRLPMKDGEVDLEQTSKMVDDFIANGFNYFDTAHGYLDEKSEVAVRECLTSRHDRSEYLLADKLSSNYFETNADIRPFFESQLKICGVDYFDFYLMHAQSSKNYPHYQECKAYEECYKLKEEGKIRHLGMSFHDTPEYLEKILNDHPEIEFVQLQFNYFDYDSQNVQSRACYEVCVKHNKPVIVMEPIKGGKLANLTDEARAVFDGLDKNASSASYAVRFAASFENVFMVLSGMSSLQQMQDNISYMKDFKPLNNEELEAVKRVYDIIQSVPLIECTACHYCTSGCPMNIVIPEIFEILNNKTKFPNADTDRDYGFATKSHGKASDCIKCGKCEAVCPQHLMIRDLLVRAANELE